MPSGYTLAKMTAALAYFTTSGNDLKNYPSTPYQILYASATNTFSVTAETSFFVPIANLDDSPTIIGDFPTDTQLNREPGVLNEYFFGHKECGGHD